MDSHVDQQTLRRARAQDIALFRYRLIGPALDTALSSKQRGVVVRGIAGRVHVGATGRVVRVSRKSLDRWIRAWRAGGFEALVPAPRQPEPRTDPDMLALAAGLKRENPQRTAAQVARLLVGQCGWAPSERTLQRLFVRQELDTPRTGPVFGRFEAEAPNQLWTGDALCRSRHNASYVDCPVMPNGREESLS
jgi:putative transposase